MAWLAQFLQFSQAWIKIQVKTPDNSSETCPPMKGVFVIYQQKGRLPLFSER